MSTTDRRERERAARRRLIIDTARSVAESEGWDAVTTRRLSTEIEYSQPVLYSHFAGMDQIVDAVAVDGFGELAAALGGVEPENASARAQLEQVGRAYLDFARRNPAVYDAMFTRSTTLRFADGDAPSQLTEAFDALRRAVGMVADAADADTLTEVFWSALHGSVTLGRTERLRAAREPDRLRLLVEQFAR